MQIDKKTKTFNREDAYKNLVDDILGNSLTLDKNNEKLIKR